MATIRAEASPADAVTALWKDEGARRIELDALTEDECGDLGETLLGGSAETIVARWAYTMSAGNPLYLRELLHEAIGTGTIAREDGLWRLRRRWRPGPALTELVAQRLRGLDEDRVVLLAAVGLGEPLEEEVAVEAVGADPISELDRLGLIAVEAGERGRAIRLGHPLYGEVAAARLRQGRLDELRKLLAAAVRRRGSAPGDALRVAIWLRDAGARTEPALLLDAAAEAFRGRDPALAAELAERAEQEGAGPAAVLTLGQSLAALGRHADAERELSRIEDAPRDRSDAQVYLFARLNVLVWGLREVGRAESLVNRAEAWWPDPAWRRFTTAQRLMVLSAAGSVARAVAIAGELAVEPATDPSVGRLLNTSGAIAWLHAGRTERALAAVGDALPAPPADERLGDLEIAGLVSWSLVRLEAGREWDEVESRVLRIERASVGRGDRIAAGPAAGLLGYLALSRGAARSAIRRLREAAGHLELHDPRALSVVIEAHRAQAAALLGDLEQARQAAADAQARLGEREAAWHERPRLVIADAWGLAAAGEPSRGVAILLAEAAGMDEWPLLQAQILSEALSLGAPPARVLAGFDQVVARCDCPRVALAAAHARALAAGDAGALVKVAVGLDALGAYLGGAEAAAQAASVFEAESILPAARRARAHRDRLLDRCEGASTPALRAAGGGGAKLTRRELEVAGLAAAGRSNAEIAAQLVISVRTVESHLYHAMSKLGAPRRGELAVALAPRDQGSAQELS